MVIITLIYLTILVELNAKFENVDFSPLYNVCMNVRKPPRQKFVLQLHSILYFAIFACIVWYDFLSSPQYCHVLALKKG